MWNKNNEPREFVLDSDGESVKISADALTTVAGIAAADVEGVAALVGNVADSVFALIGKKKADAGVRVDQGENGLILSLGISVSYGYSVPEVAKKVQQEVLTAVENMTGVKLFAVNVTVADIAVRS